MTVKKFEVGAVGLERFNDLCCGKLESIGSVGMNLTRITYCGSRIEFVFHSSPLQFPQSIITSSFHWEQLEALGIAALRKNLRKSHFQSKEIRLGVVGCPGHHEIKNVARFQATLNISVDQCSDWVTHSVDRNLDIERLNRWFDAVFLLIGFLYFNPILYKKD